jgi:hypothetical protein
MLKMDEYISVETLKMRLKETNGVCVKFLTNSFFMVSQKMANENETKVSFSASPKAHLQKES